MSNSIVGNNGTPTDCLSWFETEIDEDEYEDMEGELVDEENVFGRRGIVPKNSNSTTVTVFYYYYAPTSEWYWDYSYGVNYKPVIPVVFAADANWNLTQCLNASFSETSFTGQANGWKALNVTLTRKLVEGERIVFGVYSDLIGYVSTGEIEDADTTMAYFYWTRAKRRDYASAISYVSSPEFISQQRNIFNDYEICICNMKMSRMGFSILVPLLEMQAFLPALQEDSLELIERYLMLLLFQIHLVVFYVKDF